MNRALRRLAPVGLALTSLGLILTRTGLRGVGAVPSTYWIWALLVLLGLPAILLGSGAVLVRDGASRVRRVSVALAWPAAWALLVLIPWAGGETVLVDGLARTYRVTVPPGDPPPGGRPAVLVLHGFVQTPGTIARLTGADRLAEDRGAVVVYPRGTWLSWNDGDDTKPATKRGVDDLAFVRRLLEVLPDRHGVDPARIYAMGFSNGGYLLVRHACALRGRLAAMGVVGAGAYPLGPGTCESGNPAVPAYFILGGNDPTVAPLRERFDVNPTRSAELWSRAAGCGEIPGWSDLPDRADDGMTTRVLRYRDCRGIVDARQAEVRGAGHTWPGGPQYLPVALVGGTTRDFDATLLMWDFFTESGPDSPPVAGRARPGGSGRHDPPRSGVRLLDGPTRSQNRPDTFQPRRFC